MLPKRYPPSFASAAPPPGCPCCAWLERQMRTAKRQLSQAQRREADLRQACAELLNLASLLGNGARS